MSSRSLHAVAGLAAAALLATACGGNGTTSDTTPTDTGSAATDTGSPTSGQTTGGTVTLVTHDSFAVSDDVLQAFEDDTGITVDVLQGGDAGQVVNQAILTAGNPQGDVLFGVDNTFLSRALDADLFVPYTSSALDAVDPSLVLDDQHRVTPIDTGDVCLNYDRAWFDEHPDVPVPATLQDLTDPAYGGQLVVENPATSSPGLAFLLATVATFGEDGYLDYWQQLRDNDVYVSAGWEDAYYSQFSGGSGEGTRPLVVSYASSPPAEVYYAETPPETAPTGAITSSCFRQVEFAGILRGTAHEAAAQKLVDFLLSKPFQEDIPLQMFVFPARTDATLPDVFVQYAATVDDPITMTPDQIGAGRDGWIEAWTRTVLR